MLPRPVPGDRQDVSCQEGADLRCRQGVGSAEHEAERQAGGDQVAHSNAQEQRSHDIERGDDEGHLDQIGPKDEEKTHRPAKEPALPPESRQEP